MCGLIRKLSYFCWLIEHSYQYSGGVESHLSGLSLSCTTTVVVNYHYIGYVCHLSTGAVRSHKQTSPKNDDVNSFLKGLFFRELKKSSLQIASYIEKSAFVKKKKVHVDKASL